MCPGGAGLSKGEWKPCFEAKLVSRGRFELERKSAGQITALRESSSIKKTRGKGAHWAGVVSLVLGQFSLLIVLSPAFST